MATLNKTSVRAEIDRLRTEFEQLSSDGKVSAETRVVVNGLLVVIELILSIFLEKKTRKNTKNSSLPSSQTEKDETAMPQFPSKSKGTLRLLPMKLCRKSTGARASFSTRARVKLRARRSQPPLISGPLWVKI